MPAIAWCGLTEEQARNERREVGITRGAEGLVAEGMLAVEMMGAVREPEKALEDALRRFSDYDNDNCARAVWNLSSTRHLSDTVTVEIEVAPSYAVRGPCTPHRHRGKVA